MNLKFVAGFMVIVYGAMLCVVGITGIVSVHWELTKVFMLDPTSWPDEVRATFINQYRFLKAVEFGAGLFCLTYWRSILIGEKASMVFIILVAAGIIARTIAWIVEGQPSMPFIIFLALEILVLAVVALYLKQNHAS